LASRESDSFADKLLAAMRHKFGGHALPGPVKNVQTMRWRSPIGAGPGFG
jgi:hypothetical protein